ncbi:hypothetical protein M6I34_00390 [Burkholderiaceae bacterium FT117]|uniref:hypothetical protein n=1 Tax=Zeimonas sediminis TaxID=2944268 RepID=UPI002342C3E9|nr:hypothetical protein [Zeimonas sediminis]MCM5568959.1 hypothetical protein [Zeimonas sediminis]
MSAGPASRGAQRASAPLFSVRIAAILVAALSAWLVVVLPGELRWTEEARPLGGTILGVAAQPRSRVASVRIDAATGPGTVEVRLPAFGTWQAGQIVPLLQRGKEFRLDAWPTRYPRSLVGTAGIVALAALLLLAEMARRARRRG